MVEDVDWLVLHVGEPVGLILDLGCGTGEHSLALAEKGFRVVASDFSEGMLRRARETRPAGARVTFRRADFNNGLLAHDASFDHALSIWALQHARNPRAVLGEVARVLRAGAYFLVVVPAATTGHARRTGFRGALRRLSRRTGLRRAAGRRIGSSELRELLASAGFEVVGDRSIDRYTRILARREKQP